MMWYNDIMDKKTIILVALAIIAIMNICALIPMRFLSRRQQTALRVLRKMSNGIREKFFSFSHWIFRGMIW